MFRQSSDDEYAACSESGDRYLFNFGQYEFHDTMDGEGEFHHFVVEHPGGDAERRVYEVDHETMYEFMARYLAGEYEKQRYGMDRSPGHDALLDSLEMATARARGGETEFEFDDLDRGEVEVIDPDEDADPGEDPAPEEGAPSDEHP